MKWTVAPTLSRRAMLGALVLPPLAGGCSTPMPLLQAPATELVAAERLRDSAQAHGLDAYGQLHDINVSYDGTWRPLVGRIQPEIVDQGFRGSSQERLLPRAGVVAQAYTGPQGHKQVWWSRGRGTPSDLGEVAVWVNGARSTDTSALQGAALVAEGYGLFLLGPLWLVGRQPALQMGGTERVDGRLCDVVEAWLSPGLGRVALDRVTLCIDRSDALVRRMRFTLQGVKRAQGAVAEVDTYDHERRFGVVWPMRSYERVVHPLPLPVHDWHITGLDVNRGYTPADVAGPTFTGAASAKAKSL